MSASVGQPPLTGPLGIADRPPFRDGLAGVPSPRSSSARPASLTHTASPLRRRVAAHAWGFVPGARGLLVFFFQDSGTTYMPIATGMACSGWRRRQRTQILCGLPRGPSCPSLGRGAAATAAVPLHQRRLALLLSPITRIHGCLCRCPIAAVLFASAGCVARPYKAGQYQAGQEVHASRGPQHG